MSNKNNKPQKFEDNVVVIDIHKQNNDLPQASGSFAVGQLEDEFATTLTPVKVKEGQESLFKNKVYKKFKRAANAPKENYISAKKLQPRKASWKKRMFKIAVVLVLGVVTGSILGGWYKNYTDGMFDSSLYPTDVTPYLDDTDAIFSSVLGTDNPDKDNFAQILKSQNKTPLDYSASENYALATYKASLANTFYLESIGSVTTMGITQSVYSIRAFDGNTYELTSQSVGLLTLGICAVYNKNGNGVKLVNGENIGETTADWTGTVKNYTIDEFLDENGSLPSVLSPYIVSSKTINNEEDIQIEETVLNDKKVYTYEMQLDAIPAAAYYYKQVKLTSGLADYPIFSTISIRVYIDEEWNFVRTQIKESYTVKYGIAAACSGELTINYTFNEQVDLPYKG